MSTVCDASNSQTSNQDHRKVDNEGHDVISQTSGEERRRRWVRFFDRESYRHYHLFWKSRQFSELLYYVRHGFLKSRAQSLEPTFQLPALRENLATPMPGIDNDVIGVGQSPSSSLEFQMSMASCYSFASPSASVGSSHTCKSSRRYKARRTAALVVTALMVLLVSAITAMTVLHLYLIRDVDSSNVQSRLDLPEIPFPDSTTTSVSSTGRIPLSSSLPSGATTTSPSKRKTTSPSPIPSPPVVSILPAQPSTSVPSMPAPPASKIVHTNPPLSSLLTTTATTAAAAAAAAAVAAKEQQVLIQPTSLFSAKPSSSSTTSNPITSTHLSAEFRNKTLKKTTSLLQSTATAPFTTTAAPATITSTSLLKFETSPQCPYTKSFHVTESEPPSTSTVTSTTVTDHDNTQRTATATTNIYLKINTDAAMATIMATTSMISKKATSTAVPTTRRTTAPSTTTTIALSATATIPKATTTQTSSTKTTPSTAPVTTTTTAPPPTTTTLITTSTTISTKPTTSTTTTSPTTTTTPTTTTATTLQTTTTSPPPPTTTTTTPTTTTTTTTTPIPTTTTIQTTTTASTTTTTPTTTTTTTTTPTTTTTTTTTPIPTTTTTTTTTTTPFVPPTTLDPYASFFGGGSPDGAGGMAFGGLDFGFGGSNFGGTAAGADASTGAAGGGGSSRVGAPMGDSAMDYEELLRDMPPKEILPDPIATKVALTPAPLTTQPPVFTKPPEIEMITKDVVAEIGMSPSNNLKVTCTARKAWGWTYMSLSRYEGDNEFSLEFLGGVEKRDEWPFIPIDSRMSDFSLHRDDSQVTLSLETKYAMCEDKGRYLCEIIVNRTFHSKTFNVDVRKKPDPPVLQFPEDVFEGDVIWIVTTWDAGNPLIGHIVHDVVKGFRGLPFSAQNEQTISWKQDCTIMVENKYSVKPSRSWNGTEIIARIAANKNITDYQHRVVERVRSHRRTLTVLDKSLCLGKTGQKIEHPYSCNKYVTCYSNGPRVSGCPHLMCFDIKLQLCRYMNL